MFATIICLAIAYTLGSLCSAVIVCKAMGMPDPRTAGSKNPGATNVLRTSGKQAALLTLAGDVLKGFVPVILARLFGVSGFALGLVALAAFLGHLFPVFFEFKGGKGVATAFGSILGMSFLAGILTAFVWLGVGVISSYISLSSLAAAVIAPLLIIWQVGFGSFVPIFAISALIFWRHQDNINRLKTGTENKTDVKNLILAGKADTTSTDKDETPKS